MWGALILAGGSGARMGAGRNKVLLPLGGKAVLSRSVEAFLPHAETIIVVARPEDEKDIRAVLAADGLPVERLIFAPGGKTRQDSVRNGLAALPAGCDCVMIHDGARCLVDEDTILRVKASVEACGTGVAAIQAIDTIKQADERNVAVATPARASLRAIQTPQGFRTALILQAHEKAAADGYVGTDDASLLEYCGLSVQLVEGHRRNLKMTTPEDMIMAEALLSGGLPALRVGQGYDVHRLVEGRELILCGVNVPHTLGLLGHSDADVALHALMDAMLGAMALGDIGRHFPDTDERFKGISSMKLLEHVLALLKEHRARVTNADVTIVAQKPKLLPYVPAMRENVAQALGLPLDRVHVKATTTERLAFEGREEGISAQAIVMVQER